MKYKTTYKINKECKPDSTIILTFINPNCIEEDEKMKYVNLLKLRFKSTETIVLEELEFQINKCLDENSVERIYIGKVLEDLYVTFIYYCKIDLNYHTKINNLQIELDREVEIIKLTDPYWNTAHKLLNNNE